MLKHKNEDSHTKMIQNQPRTTLNDVQEKTSKLTTHRVQSSAKSVCAKLEIETSIYLVVYQYIPIE